MVKRIFVFDQRKEKTFQNQFFEDQNKDGEINRKDMIKIIEAMYDLANEEDRTTDKAPDKRVDLIMQRLNKDKDGRIQFLIDSIRFDWFFLCLEIILRQEFIDGCLRDELLRKILAPNTTLLGEESSPMDVGL